MALSPDGTAAPSPARRPPRRRARRWVLGILGTILLLAVAVGVCAVLIVRDAFVARDALDEAATTVPAVSQAIRDRLRDPAPDAPSLADDPALLALQESTETARDATDGPVWWLAAHLPGIGPSVGAATTVSAVIDDVADVALPALAMTADAAARTTRTDDGGIDLAPLAAVAADTAHAHDVVTAAHADLDAVDLERVQAEFVGPVVDLADQLGALDRLLATAERTTTLLPAMLGADGPRRYLLLGMSNAELRAAGGIPGALMEVEIDGGRVAVGAQAATGDVGPFRRPVLPLDPADEAAYTTRLGRFVQDVTLTPDFATTGPLAAEMWRRSQDVEVDGVLATDPVALSYLLEATGPVRVDLPRGIAAAIGTDRVTAEPETVVDLLLRRTYEVLDDEQADRFYAVVAAAVLDELSNGDVAPADLLAAFERAAREHRLLVWSARPDEQADLAGTLVAGTFADDRARDAVGVFLDDLVVGKLSAYLEVQVGVAESVCTGEGRADTVRVTLTNRLDADAAASLPDYVAGPPDDPDRGRMQLTLSAYGTRGGDVPRLTRDDGPVAGETLDVHGRDRVAVTVDLDPGDSTAVDVTVGQSATAARGEGSARPGDLEVWATPTVSSSGLHVLDVPVCG
jgi:hypothetical protein